jgi:hypothetical protein
MNICGHISTVLGGIIGAALFWLGRWAYLSYRKKGRLSAPPKATPEPAKDYKGMDPKYVILIEGKPRQVVRGSDYIMYDVKTGDSLVPWHKAEVMEVVMNKEQRPSKERLVSIFWKMVNSSKVDADPSVPLGMGPTVMTLTSRLDFGYAGPYMRLWGRDLSLYVKPTGRDVHDCELTTSEANAMAQAIRRKANPNADPDGSRAMAGLEKWL